MSKPGRFSIRRVVNVNEGETQSDGSDTLKTAYDRAGVTANDHTATPAHDRTVTEPFTPAEKVLKRPAHLSLYVGPRVNKALKEIALARDCKVHDLLLEGLDHVLTKHGRSLKDLIQKS